MPQLVRVLLLSDIHSNLEALEAVLAAAEIEGFDQLWCLGDLTGYGPDPAAVITRLQRFPKAIVLRGNHDRVVAHLARPTGFNPHAVVAVYKNKQGITPAQTQWLAELPESYLVDDRIVLSHGSPVDPDEYLLDLRHTEASFQKMNLENRRLGLFGHTHTPRLYEFNREENQYYDVDIEVNEVFALNTTGPMIYLLNPGSVGQPRDGDCRAAYAFLEIGEAMRVSFRRTEYPIHECQAKMAALEYPDILIKRLNVGF